MNLLLAAISLGYSIYLLVRVLSGASSWSLEFVVAFTLLLLSTVLNLVFALGKWGRNG